MGKLTARQNRRQDNGIPSSQYLDTPVPFIINPCPFKEMHCQLELPVNFTRLQLQREFGSSSLGKKHQGTVKESKKKKKSGLL